MSITELAPTTTPLDDVSSSVLESQPKTLPEVVPSVAFDINLKRHGHLKPGEVVDFDYHAFGEEAQKMGATDQDIVGANISFLERAGKGVPYSPDRPGKKSGGRFSYTTDGSEPSHISVAYRDDVPGMNVSLAHEFQHYLDHSRGLNEKEDYRKYEKAVEAQRSWKTRFAIMSLGNIALGAGVLSGNPRAAVLGLGSSVYAWAKSRAADKYYTDDPSEIRAREAEEKHGHMQSIVKAQAD